MKTKSIMARPVEQTKEFEFWIEDPSLNMVENFRIIIEANNWTEANKRFRKFINGVKSRRVIVR